MNHHLREIVDCLDEALRLQSRVLDLTEQVYEAAGMSPGVRTLRGKVTGLFFGLHAHVVFTDLAIYMEKGERIDYFKPATGALGAFPT